MFWLRSSSGRDLCPHAELLDLTVPPQSVLASLASSSLEGKTRKLHGQVFSGRSMGRQVVMS